LAQLPAKALEAVGSTEVAADIGEADKRFTHLGSVFEMSRSITLGAWPGLQSRS
jgi:hypothetical protein